MYRRYLTVIRALAVLAVLVAAAPGVAGAQEDPDTLPTPEEVVGESESGEREAWRVAPSDEPPIQVRRAVETVVGTTHEVIRDITGGDAGSGEGGAEEGREPPRVLKDGDEGENREDGADPTPTPKLRTVERDRDRDAATDEHERRHRERAEGTGVQTSSGRSLFDRVEELFARKHGPTMNFDPYVEDSRWNEAMELLVDDECREAIDVVDTIFEEADEEREDQLRSTPAVQYAVARIKLCAGQPAEGRKTLRRLADSGGEHGVSPAVAELARRRLGHSPSPIRVERKRDDRNEEASGTFWEQLASAKKIAGSEGLSKAVDSLWKLHDTVEHAWQRYRVRMTEAELLLAHGKVADGARALMGVYEMTRDWRIGDKVADKIAEIERREGIQILTLGARIDRMRELIDRGKYSKAKRVSIENAKIAGVSGKEIEGWSFYRRGLQAERQRNRRRADELFEKSEKLTKSPVIRSRLYFGWARALRRLDRDSEAIKLYERLCREYPRHHLCDDSTYEAGRLSQYQNKHGQARQKFADLVGMFPDSDFVPDALWRGAISAYIQEDYEAMDRPLQQLIDHYGTETDSSGLPLGLKARYWRAAAAFERGDMKQARRRLQATINKGALTWYGALAAARLKKIGERPVIPMPNSDLSRRTVLDLNSLDVPETKRLKVVAEYARLGLWKDAKEELKRQMNHGPAPEKSLRLLGTLMLLNDEAPEAHWMMKEHIELSAPTRYTLRDWGIAYPLVFMEHAHKWGVKYDVSPFLSVAIMRQESAFRPRVSSYVGAAGLMQLMPGTANWLSDQFLDGRYISRGRLNQPDKNIQLGTLYTRVALEMTSDNVPMTLAAYNAGPAPVKSWLRRFGDSKLDAWVEMITYREARGYVRKVYTNYLRYSALYGGGYPELSLELPDKLRDIEDIPALEKLKNSKPVASF